MKEFYLFLAGLCAGMTFLGDVYLFAGGGVVLFLGLYWLNRDRKENDSPVTQVIQQIVKEDPIEDHTPFKGAIESQPQKGMEYRFKKKFRTEMESELDLYLFEGISFLRNMIPTAHTAGIFFPGRRPETLVLRIFDSESEHVLNQAEISHGQGLIGQLLKKDVGRVFEGDLANSRVLFYYKEQVEVHSVIAVPIFVLGHFNGVVFVDSLEQGAFGPDQVEELKSFAKLMGILAYKYYIGFEHLYEKEQFSGLLDYQKKFLKDTDQQSIFNHLVDFIESNLNFERLMILEKSEENPMISQVVVAKGLYAEMYADKKMELKGMSFLSLCFMNNVPLSRVSQNGEYIIRINEDEYRSEELKSITAIPICTRGSKVDLVISIENRRQKELSKHHVNLLMSIGSLAGFALSRARAFQKKEQMATRDTLTGLYNLRAFKERFREEIQRCKRSKSSMGIIMLDIDHFKRINDSHGHPTGDKVLQAFAGILQNQVRDGIDIVARYGGEEFIIILSESPLEVIRETSERIRSAVQQMKINNLESGPIQITTSIGWAVYPIHSEESERIIELADKALYKAKHSGRNQVVGWQ